jgi:glycine/D-amino acid oxidase-like deaminating enzyme
MKQTADVVIIGGGVTGLLTAIYLQQLTTGEVLLLERHYIGSGQSHRAAGVVRALVRDPTVAGALAESLCFFKTFSDHFEEQVALHSTGYLLLAEPEQTERIDETIAAAAQVGCEARQIDYREAQLLQPGLREDPETLYVYEPGAIHLDPMPTVQAIRRQAERLGVTIIEGCEVSNILTRGDRVSGVETSSGQFETRQILVATSVWGQRQLARLGIDVPVYSHRAEMAFFHLPSTRPFTLFRTLSDARSMLYLRPEGEQQMFVGWREGDRIQSTSDLVAQDPDDYKQTTDFETVVEMQRRLVITLPPMCDGFVHRTYACVYDMTPDEMPILDRAESIEGLYFALGFSGGGFSLSPWVGRAMAEFMVHQKRPAQIEGFDLNRFGEGRTFDWSNVARTSSS